MNPLTLNDTTNLFFEIDGGRHTSHKFELKSPDDHMVDTVLSGIEIAGGIYDEPGKLQVKYTTPANYTVPGLD